MTFKIDDIKVKSFGTFRNGFHQNDQKWDKRRIHFIIQGYKKKLFFDSLYYLGIYQLNIIALGIYWTNIASMICAVIYILLSP